MNAALLDRVKSKLPPWNDREALEVVAKGSGIPFHTLLKIAKGETVDPRTSTLQSLLDFYEGRAA